VGVIFDSCIWVGLAVGQLDKKSVINVCAQAPVFSSVISLGELAFGVHSCQDPAERALRAAYLRKIETRPILQISKNTASAFGVLAAAVKQSGRSPRPRYNDLWIAAQAIENGYQLLTTNPADFVSLPGLQLLFLQPTKSKK
jgi:predicted nucleic acid-binding protein